MYILVGFVHIFKFVLCFTNVVMIIGLHYSNEISEYFIYTKRIHKRFLQVNYYKHIHIILYVEIPAHELHICRYHIHTHVRACVFTVLSVFPFTYSGKTTSKMHMN